VFQPLANTSEVAKSVIDDNNLLHVKLKNGFGT
jgi:hypothetical protein